MRVGSMMACEASVGLLWNYGLASRKLDTVESGPPFTDFEKLPCASSGVKVVILPDCRVGVLPLALIGEEEEQLVAAIHHVRHVYRPAHRAAVLVAFQNLPRDALLVVEEGIGIQVFVAQIVESRAVHASWCRS